MSDLPYDPRKTYFTCRDCGRYLTKTEAAKSSTCAGCRVQAIRAADRPAHCREAGCTASPTEYEVDTNRWLCKEHSAAGLAAARAAAQASPDRLARRQP